MSNHDPHNQAERSWWERFHEGWGFGNPVFRKEWLALRRNRQLVVVVAGMLALVVLLSAATSHLGKMPSAIYIACSPTVQSAWVVLLTPALLSGSMAGEREKRSLGPLALTRLSALEMCWGKLMAGLLPVFLVLAILNVVRLIFPGEWEYGMTVQGFQTAPVFSTLFLVGGMSLLSSALWRSRLAGLVFSYAAVLALLVGVPTVRNLMPLWSGSAICGRDLIYFLRCGTLWGHLELGTQAPAPLVCLAAAAACLLLSAAVVHREGRGGGKRT